MTTITEIAETMQTLLTVTANQLGRETGLIQRQRRLTGAGFAQALVFGWLANPASTRAELQQAAATVGMAISTPGLDQRFTPAAVVFLQRLLDAALAAFMTEQTVTLGQHFEAIRVVDTSQIAFPAAAAQLWSAQVDPTQAVPTHLKVGVDWDIQHGRVCGMTITSARLHDQKTGIQATALPVGSLRLHDLGFFDLAQFARYNQQQVYFVTRLKTGTRLYTSQGQDLDLETVLARTASAGLDLPVQVGAQQRLPARLVAVRVTAQIAQQRRRQLRQQAKRKGQTVSARRLALADWSIFITNLPASRFSLAQVETVIRLRWQVELLFKLWKSGGLLDQWHSRQPERIMAEFYAKLIALMVQHWLLLVHVGQPLRQSLTQAAQVIRKHAFHLASVLRDWEALGQALAILAQTLRHSCQRQPRRQHPLAFQLWQDAFYDP